MSSSKAPECFFFTSPGLITPQLASSPLGFGPSGGNEFKLTTKFSITLDAMAYSICKGIVLIQPQIGSADKVNLILRPYTQPFPGLNVKYFVYRGMKRSDFFTSDAIPKIVPAAGSSEFISKIRSDFASFYSETLYDNSTVPPTVIPVPDFTGRFIGFNENVSEVPLTTKLSDFFFKESAFVEAGAVFNELDNFELPMIDAGKSLGHFASGTSGIDVVLNYGDYTHDFDNGEFKFDLNYARAAEAKLTLTGSETEYESKLKREQITQFIDIVAFYGLYVKAGKVKTKTSGVTAEKSGTAIYTDLLTPFATKNNWYIYIQSDRTRSYNFYNTYKIAEGNLHSLKKGIVYTETIPLTESDYYTENWPVLIETQTQTVTPENQNKLYLQLVTDNNINTVLYCSIGTVVNAQKDNFSNADYLRQPPDTEGNFSSLTTMIELKNAAAADGKNIAGLTLLYYQGVAYNYLVGTTTNEEDETVNVYAQPNYFDDVFDLIKAKPLLVLNSQTEFSKMTSEKLNLINHYFDKLQQGISAVQTLTVNDIIDTGDTENPTLGRVAYITETMDILSNAVSPTGTITPDTKTSVSSSGTVVKSKTYILKEPYYYNLKLFTDSTQTITGLELKTVDGSTPTKIILGITQAENEFLQGLINATSLLKNSRIFLQDLFEDGNELLSPENIKYQKYKVGIVGETDDGVLKLSMPEMDIFVYSFDKKYHFSKGYSEFIKLSNISDKELIINKDFE